jgi:hypothetical protein
MSIESPFPSTGFEERSMGLDGLPTCGHTPAGPTASTMKHSFVTERLCPCLMPEPDLLQAVEVCLIMLIGIQLNSPVIRILVYLDCRELLKSSALNTFGAQDICQECSCILVCSCTQAFQCKVALTGDDLLALSTRSSWRANQLAAMCRWEGHGTGRRQSKSLITANCFRSCAIRLRCL